jgi:hypothetical protein
MTEEIREKEEEKSWKDEVQEMLAQNALAFNYEYGITCRILPIETEEGVHVARLMLDLTHSGFDIDMEFQARFADDPTGNVSWKLTAVEGAPGTVWEEVHRSHDDFRKAVSGLPYFVQGFFAGRRAQEAAQSAEVSSGS